MSLAVLILTTPINGYDVSNVANIQPALYKSFGNIKLLSWFNLSFSLAVSAVLSLSRNYYLLFLLEMDLYC
ncbi:Major facilitator superfamily domain general substrate transporter [Penicillium tannophilum]|nr:Major facilitator superfamily domain general substrate transporter [Penicillium tannophilum]